MSSHHFVREGQEPALIMATEAPQAHPLFDQLAAWNPVLISFDRYMPYLMVNRIACDHLLAEDRLEDWKDMLHEHASVHICTPEEQPHIISRILSSYDCRSARYLTDGESAFGSWEKLASLVDITVITPTIQWVYIRHASFRKWLPKGTHVHIQGCGHYRMNESVITTSKMIESDALYHATGDMPFWWGESIVR